jgi:electron transfer flavoprotein alpha subunit
MSILVIAEHDKGELKGATLATIAAAQQLGDQIDLLVAGSDCAGAAEQAAKVTGVTRVLLAENTAYDHLLAENTALLIAELAKDYSHVLAPASTNGKNVLPRAAALLDVQAISDVSAVIAEDTFQRPIYAGNIIATVQTSDPIKMLTVRTTAFDPVPAEGGSATVEKLDSVHQTDLSEYKGEEVRWRHHLGRAGHAERRQFRDALSDCGQARRRRGRLPGGRRCRVCLQ